jgi:hypothetical protein
LEGGGIEFVAGGVEDGGVAVDVVAVALENGWPVDTVDGASGRSGGKPGRGLSLTERHGVTERETPDSAGFLFLCASVPP